MNFCFRRRDLTSDTGKGRWVSRRRRSLSCRSKVNLNSYRSAAETVGKFTPPSLGVTIEAFELSFTLITLFAVW